MSTNKNQPRLVTTTAIRTAITTGAQELEAKPAAGREHDGDPRPYEREGSASKRTCHT